MLIGCDIPFNVLLRAQFKDFVHMLKGDAQLISPQTAKICLHDSSNQILAKTVERIQDTKFHVTYNVWLAPGMTASYMAVVVHFIDPRWEYCEHLVGFEKLKGKHTGDNMSISMSSIFLRGNTPFKIQNIMAFTTDGASNNCTMATAMNNDWSRFNSRTHHLHCFAHILNLLAQVFWCAIKNNGDVELPLDQLNDDDLIDKFDHERYQHIMSYESCG